MLVVRCPDTEVSAVQAPPRQEVPLVAKKPQIAVQVSPCPERRCEGERVNYDDGTGQAGSRSRGIRLRLKVVQALLVGGT
jgi:hypothetical protein